MLIHQDNLIRIYQGDSRHIVELADESVQCCVTSPPYWGLRKYAGEQEMVWGGKEACEHEWGEKGQRLIAISDKREAAHHSERDKMMDGMNILTGQFCSLCGAWRGDYGLEPTIEMYVEHTLVFLREIRRILRPDGVVFWNIGDCYQAGNRGASVKSDLKRGTQGGSFQPQNIGAITGAAAANRLTQRGLKPKDLCLIPFRVALAAQADGWWVRSVIIWSKNNPMPESVTDRPTESHEYILMLTKSAKYYWDAESVRERSNSAGATGFTPLGSSALAPELITTLNTDNGAPNLRGRLNLRESQITIEGTMTWKTEDFEIIKAISFEVIGEQSKGQFMIDLESGDSLTPLALITSTFKSLVANHTPVRATIIDTSPSPSGTSGANQICASPTIRTGPTTKTMLEPIAILRKITEKGGIALVTFEFNEARPTLLVRGSLRSSHLLHDTTNIGEVQVGRNMRSVWNFPSAPYKLAHFATFSEELPERCIKAATPEAGVCSKCGKPWVRVIAHQRPMDYDAGEIDQKQHEGTGGFSHNRPLSKIFDTSLKSSIQTLGWKPQCGCGAEAVPSLILDPFCGSGTTLWVAKKLGRRAVGYDISAEYCQLALERNRQMGLCAL